MTEEQMQKVLTGEFQPNLVSGVVGLVSFGGSDLFPSKMLDILKGDTTPPTSPTPPTTDTTP